jgi:hypothetical protein
LALFRIPPLELKRTRTMHRLQADNLFHIPKIMCDRCVAALTSALHALD